MVNSQPKAFHRDIKPPNILLDANGTAKMADFGLAGTVKQKGKGHLTVEEISGTPGYADPQYIQSGRVTEASEVYSFGTVLLELLMNERPALCGPKGDIIYPLVQVVQPGAPGALERILGRLDAQASWPRPPVEELSELALRCVSTRGRPAFEEVVETLRRLYHASAAGANQAGQWTPSQWQQHSPQPQPQPQQQQQQQQQPWQQQQQQPQQQQQQQVLMQQHFAQQQLAQQQLAHQQLAQHQLAQQQLAQQRLMQQRLLQQHLMQGTAQQSLLQQGLAQQQMQELHQLAQPQGQPQPGQQFDTSQFHDFNAATVGAAALEKA